LLCCHLHYANVQLNSQSHVRSGCLLMMMMDGGGHLCRGCSEPKIKCRE
jgi:hypothetical protein